MNLIKRIILRIFVNRNNDVITFWINYNCDQHAKFSWFDIPEYIILAIRPIYEFFVTCYDDVIGTQTAFHDDQWGRFLLMAKFHEFLIKIKMPMVSYGILK